MKATLLAAATAAFASTALSANIPSILPLAAPNTTLIVSFGDITISNPGRILTRPQTTPQPVVSIPQNSGLTNSTYLLLMIDPSINTTNPTYAGLHEIVSGLHLSQNNTLISSATSQLAPYVYPQVPPSAGLSKHSYTLLLFQQPANLTIPETFASFLPYPTSLITRVGFPLLEFINQVGLGRPVAANWFLEGAYTANATTSSTGSASTAPGRSSTTAASASAATTSASTTPSTSPSPATGAASAINEGVMKSLAMALIPALVCVGGVLRL